MNINVSENAPLTQEEIEAKTLERVEEINIQENQKTIPNGFEVDEEGVWYLQEKKNGSHSREKICSPLWITSYTRDDKNENHGRVLEFKDTDGHKHIWTMPMELLAGESLKILAPLLNMGLRILHRRKDKERLLEYIAQCNPTRRARCVLQCGWFKDTFVLPKETIGYIQSEDIIFQNPSPLEIKNERSGTLDGWKEQVAQKATGNSRLVLAICASFASPLLHLMNHENIGIHFRGNSSLGKSTALYVANSVWDSPSSIHSYRATANGLEGIASLYNDRLLCLDELSQASPHEVGQVVYMLGNSKGKVRSQTAGLPKKYATWRLTFLSTGEISLSQLMNEGGKSVKAGQEVRLIEIPADTGKYGLFETLHEYDNGSDFSIYLKDTCSKFYGSAAKVFLENLVQDKEGSIGMIKCIINGLKQRFLPFDSSTQDTRVFNHIALITAAGVLACKFGITGWSEEETIEANMKCFQAWLEARGGTGLHEEKEALSQVTSFFETHGESRFTPWDQAHKDSSRTPNRVGFRKKIDEGTEFYVFPNSFRKEICEGLDYKFAEKICVQHGILIPDSKSNPTRPEKTPEDKKSKRYYRFKMKILDVD